MEEVLVTEAEDPEKPEECVASRLSSIIGLQETKGSCPQGEYTPTHVRTLEFLHGDSFPFLRVLPACVEVYQWEGRACRGRRGCQTPRTGVRGLGGWELGTEPGTSARAASAGNH